MTGRSVPEWFGATPDTPVPPRVKARVFQAHGGRCHISGRKIGPSDKWQCDHRIALCNGGENRESNLAPALADKHRQKTAQDVDEKAKTVRMRNKHLGLQKPSRGFQSQYRRKLDGTVVHRETGEPVNRGNGDRGLLG